jgi:hypothetical protein
MTGFRTVRPRGRVAGFTSPARRAGAAGVELTAYRDLVKDG